MKTPTLIVRLIGLYLLVQSSMVLVQLLRMKEMGGGLGMTQNQVVGDIRLYAVLGLLVGLAATVFAGRLAQILTFDSATSGSSKDFEDRFLGR